MKKMSNDLERKWSNFLTSLENNHCEEKNYFEAIKYVSDIDSKTIDDEEIREKINGYIETIVQFIGKHKNYYELSNVKGFKKNDGSIRGRDYYYYIADQQIKATVYYARYLNFIEGCEITAERDLDVRVRLQNICDEHGVQLDCSNKDNKVECICKSLVEHIETNDFPAMKTLEKEVLEQVDNQSGNFEDTDSQVSNLGDNGQLTLDELKSIRIELLRYGEEYKISNNIDYRLYMMLNNMMHEIRFWGAAYQYLWHWKSYKKTLYRSGLLEKKDAEKKQDKNDDIAVHKFMKDMFQECIDHMNSPSLSRHSFSENLLIDVYKYLILEKEEHNALIKIKDENGLCIVCKSIKNEKEVEFHIIKGASINSIFVDGSDQDFSTFIQNNKIPVDYGYTVEIYPQELQGETNDKGTIKGMRDTLLPLYFKSWGIDASLRRTKVADDKEVITYGIQIFSNVTQNNQQTKDIDGIPDYLNYFNENYLCATGSGDGEFKNEIDWIDYIFFVKIYERLFIELYDSVKEWEQWELKQKKSFSFLEKSLAKEKLNGNLNLYLRYREICKTECSVHGRLCQENNISKEVLSSLSEEQWKVCISKKVIENQHTELEVFIDFDDNQQAKEAIIKYMSENHDSKLTKDFVAKVIEEYYFNKNKDEIFFWKWDDTNKNYCEIQKEEAITVGKFHIQVSKLVKFKEMFKRNTSEHLLKYIWTTYEGEDKDNWLSDNLNKFDYSRAMGILEFDCEDFKKKWMELYGDNSI